MYMYKHYSSVIITQVVSKRLKINKKPVLLKISASCHVRIIRVA